ncbi:hypothetical protein [Methanobacterium oryzae]|uniref:hypothetical protein n=1 Tax=Methanobacterium oryzae TaxID=69540 RepID=UPI003D21FBEF
MKKLHIIIKKSFSLFILIVILLSLCINFSENYYSHLTYPNPGSSVLGAPGVYTFAVSGEVIEIHADGFSILDENNIKVRIESTEKVQKGDFVEVLGFLQPSNVFKSIKVIRGYKWGNEFLILRSIFGLILLLIIFFRYWNFEFKNLVFMRRR